MNPPDILKQLEKAGCKCREDTCSITFSSGLRAEGVIPIRERKCFVLPAISYFNGYWYCHGCEAKVSA